MVNEMRKCKMRDGQEEPVNQTKGSAGNEVFGYMYTVVQAQLELCSYESKCV